MIQVFKKRLISMSVVFSILILAAFAVGCSHSVSGPLVYVANEGDGTLSVMDASSLKIVKTVKLAGMPHNVNVDPLGRYFYATNHEGEQDAESKSSNEHSGHTAYYLRIFDAKSNKLLISVLMPKLAAHAVPSRDGNMVYVSMEGGNEIAEVNVTNGYVLRKFKVGEGPHGFVLINSGRTILVPNMRSNDVSIVDLKSGSEERLNLTFGNFKCETPVAMGVTNDDNYSFVTCGRSFEVYKIDNRAKTLVGRVELKKGEFPGPIQTPVHPDGKFLYVPDMRNGVVHKIEIETFKLVSDIDSGAGAHGIAYSADGSIAYVTNTWENSLSIINLTSGSVIDKVGVGLMPNGVAVSNGKNQGW